MNFKHKVALTLGTGAAIAQLFTTAAFADTTHVNVSGNGYWSHNKVSIRNVHESKLKQSNFQYVGTDIDVHNSTGGNSADWNTGSDVKVKSGDIDNDVKVKVTGGTNVAKLNECGCDGNDTWVKVKDNGAKSHTDVYVGNYDSSYVSQENKSIVHTDIDVTNKTGHNSADGNTGKHSDVTVKSGDIDNDVSVYVGGSSNVVL